MDEYLIRCLNHGSSADRHPSPFLEWRWRTPRPKPSREGPADGRTGKSQRSRIESVLLTRRVPMICKDHRDTMTHPRAAHREIRPHYLSQTLLVSTDSAMI